VNVLCIDVFLVVKQPQTTQVLDAIFQNTFGLSVASSIVMCTFLERALQQVKKQTETETLQLSSQISAAQTNRIDRVKG
jgi:hypothetical protein